MCVCNAQNNQSIDIVTLDNPINKYLFVLISPDFHAIEFNLIRKIHQLNGFEREIKCGTVRVERAQAMNRWTQSSERSTNRKRVKRVRRSIQWAKRKGTREIDGEREIKRVTGRVQGKDERDSEIPITNHQQLQYCGKNLVYL